MINEEPWYIKGTMLIVRYYHMFVEGELEKLLEKIEGITIEKSYFDHANCISACLPCLWRRQRLHKYKNGPQFKRRTVRDLCRFGLHPDERVRSATFRPARRYSKLQTVDLAYMLCAFLSRSLLYVVCARILGIFLGSILLFGFYGFKCAYFRESAL